jgi:probable F420-dependent oxidoreductase
MMNAMARFHALLRFLPGREALELAPLVEELGFDGVTLPEHVVTPYSPPGSYPYSADGQPPFRLDSAFPEAFVLLGAIAALTTRIRLLTGVVVAPLRHPLFLARAAGTVAVLSGGRMMLGVGVGREREDFEILGADFGTRGARTDEGIEVMRAVWAGSPARHRGRFYSFEDVYVEPRPAEPVPILIGGGTDAAIARAVRLGDGVVAPGTPFAGVEDYLRRLAAALARAGRDRSTFEVVATCPSSETLDDVLRFAELGMDTIQIVPWPNPGKVDTTLAEKRAALERFAAEILEPARLAF